MQRRYRKRPPKRDPIKKFKLNHQIKAPKVRLIDEEDNNIGIILTKDAIKQAIDAGLDLVEVSPKADPPVVRIINHSQFKYEQEKKIKKQRQLQKKHEVKGIRLTFRIKGGDLDNRVQQALKFLEAGHNVKIDLMLRGRERIHRDKAVDVVKQFIEKLGDGITLVQPVNRQGSRISTEVGKKQST